MLVTRNVWIKYHNPTDGEGSDLGGGAGDDGKGSQGGEGSKDDGKGAGGTDDGGSKDDGKGAGENKPSDAEAKLLKEVMDKKTKLKAAEDRVKDLESKMKQFEGIDVEGVRKMLADKQAEETRQLEAKGQWDALKKQMVEAHNGEKAELLSKVAEKETALANLQAQIAELTVGNAFASSQFIKEEMTIPVNKARVLYAGHFEFKDGQVVAYDKASGQDRSVLVDAKGDPLSFESAIKKIIESDSDRDSLIKSKIKAGAGSSTSKKAASPDKVFDQPVGKDRIAAALSKSGIGGKK